MSPRPPLPSRIVALAPLVCLPVHGCIEVDGGAVEVSWDLRGSDGSDTDCEPAGVAGIELAWDVAGTGGTVVFPCADARGVTVFEVPEGQAALSLRPVCVGGQPAEEGAFRAPAPIVRTVTAGEVVTLATQVLEVRLAGCTEGAPCICR
jgi:hypothetical protein